jgi:hypothetical protein
MKALRTKVHGSKAAKVVISILGVILLVFGLAACSSGENQAAGTSGTSASTAASNTTVTPGVGSGYIQGQEQANTQAEANKENIFNFGKAELAELPGGPTDEMENDAERNITLDNPNRIGYAYIYDSTGTLLANYTVKGKVTSTGSELANSQDTVDDNRCSGDGACSDVVDSIGDDGTYGLEECSSNGIYFFTPSNQLVEICVASGTWIYSDAPQNLTSRPSLTLPVDSKVTSGAVSRNLAGVAPSKKK